MLRTKPLDTFLIFDAEDPLHASLCRGETETREIIDQFGCTAGLQVLRVTLDEMTRDVTADFITDEDEPDEYEYPDADLEASIADHRHQLRMEGAI